MKITTFNLRYVWNGDGINSFIHRAGMIYEKIKKEKPEVIAFQEVVKESLDFLKSIMDDYFFVGQFRDENYQGEGLFTAIRKELLELISVESMWLSDTPYVPGSKFQGQSPCPRICVISHIRNKNTGKMLRIYNVHLDYISDKICKKGIECLFKKREELDNRQYIPSVILGDFNVGPDSITIKRCNCEKEIKDISDKIAYTFHNYGKIKEKIDYIYVSEELMPLVSNIEIWNEECNGIYLSDHYPLCVNIDL